MHADTVLNGGVTDAGRVVIIAYMIVLVSSETVLGQSQSIRKGSLRGCLRRSTKSSASSSGPSSRNPHMTRCSLQSLEAEKSAVSGEKTDVEVEKLKLLLFLTLSATISRRATILTLASPSPPTTSSHALTIYETDGF